MVNEVPFGSAFERDVTASTSIPAPRSEIALAPSSTGRERDHDGWWCAAAGVLTGVALVALAHRGLGDDTYITLDYARTLVEHGQWGLIPDSEGAGFLS